MTPGLLPFERGTVRDHPYVAVGEGPPTLVLVPGLNDPLLRPTSPWWFSLVAAGVCRRYADGRRVLMVGRPRGLPDDHSTREMADGYADVLESVGPADVLGLSMGGFVVQHLAADHPDLVERAVLGMAASRMSDHGREPVERWVELTERGRWPVVYQQVLADGATDEGVVGSLIEHGTKLYGRLARPSTEARSDFVVSIDATLAHDATDRLADVSVPTLVVGAADDPLFPESFYRETAGELADGTLAFLDEGGHEAVVNRQRVFKEVVDGFLGDSEGFDPATVRGVRE